LPICKLMFCNLELGLSQKTFLRRPKETLRYSKHLRLPELRPRRIEPKPERLLLLMLKSTIMSTPRKRTL